MWTYTFIFFAILRVITCSNMYIFHFQPRTNNNSSNQYLSHKGPNQTKTFSLAPGHFACPQRGAHGKDVVVKHLHIQTVGPAIKSDERTEHQRPGRRIVQPFVASKFLCWKKKEGGGRWVGGCGWALGEAKKHPTETGMGTNYLHIPTNFPRHLHTSLPGCWQK